MQRIRARAWVIVGAVALVAGALVGLVGFPSRAEAAYQATPLPGWQVDGQTYAVAVSGGVAYVGGTFTTVTAPDGTRYPRTNLAAFDAATGTLLPFRADADGSVRALVTDGATVWAGGYFARVNGVTRNRLAAVDATTGAVRTAFRADATAPVYGLDLQGGRLYVAGAFTTLAGQTRRYAGAVDPATGALLSWNPDPGATLNGLKASAGGSTVYLAGNFTTVGGLPAVGIAAVDGTTGAVVGPTFQNEYAGAFGVDLDPAGGKLYAAIGVAGNQAAAFDLATGARLWRQRADGDVQAVAYYDGKLYFGFHEAFGGDVTLRLLAIDTSTGLLDPNFRPTFDRFWGIRGLAATPQGLYGAGDFGSVSGVTVSGLLRFAPDGPPPTTTTTAAPTTTTTTTTTTAPEPTTTTTTTAPEPTTTTTTTTTTAPEPTTTTTAPTTTTSTTPPGPVTYLGTGAIWRYRAAATAAPAGWEGPGFNDSTWPSGPSQLGFGDGDETTVIPGGTPTRFPTIYFRTTFTAARTPSSLTLSLLADDGAIVYVNGVEVARDNMTTGGFTYNTLALVSRWSVKDETTYRDFAIPASVVVPGTNTIAIRVHQDCTCSSDLSLDARLTGVG